MPSLMRFLLLISAAAAAVFTAIIALVIFVKPYPREITVSVPTEQIKLAPGPETPKS